MGIFTKQIAQIIQRLSQLLISQKKKINMQINFKRASPGDQSQRLIVRRLDRQYRDWIETETVQ